MTSTQRRRAATSSCRRRQQVCLPSSSLAFSPVRAAGASSSALASPSPLRRRRARLPRFRVFCCAAAACQPLASSRSHSGCLRYSPITNSGHIFAREYRPMYRCSLSLSLLADRPISARSRIDSIDVGLGTKETPRRRLSSNGFFNRRFDGRTLRRMWLAIEQLGKKLFQRPTSETISDKMPRRSRTDAAAARLAANIGNTHKAAKTAKSNSTPSPKYTTMTHPCHLATTANERDLAKRMRWRPTHHQDGNVDAESLRLHLRFGKLRLHWTPPPRSHSLGCFARAAARLTTATLCGRVSPPRRATVTAWRRLRRRRRLVSWPSAR